MNKQEILAKLKEVVDAHPALWAPGVTGLGWTFHIEDNKIVLNQQMGSAYLRRLFDGLPSLFPGVEISAEIKK